MAQASPIIRYVLVGVVIPFGSVATLTRIIAIALEARDVSWESRPEAYWRTYLAVRATACHRVSVRAVSRIFRHDCGSDLCFAFEEGLSSVWEERMVGVEVQAAKAARDASSVLLYSGLGR